MKIVTTSLVAAAALALAGQPASAQDGYGSGGPPMDMSGMVMNQVMLNDYANAYAQAAARQWLAQRMAYRAATGHTGYLPGPVSAQDLSASAGALDQAYDAYNQGWSQNSAATMRAIEGYSQGAILGQGTYVDPATGQTYTVTNPYARNWVDPYGNVWGTDTATPPDYRHGYKPLTPVQ